MKKQLFSIALTSLLTLVTLPTYAVEMSEEQKTLYTLGSAMGDSVNNSIGAFNLKTAELEFVKKGLLDSMNKTKPAFDTNGYMPKVQALANQRSSQLGARNIELGKVYAEKIAKEKGVEKTSSGLLYLSLKDGAGDSPAITDTVKVNYRGTLIDGKEFDSSYKRNEPIEFPLNNVIKCWGEGVQKMKAGGKAKLICPSNIAYENKPAGAIPPGSTLTFEIELLSFKKKDAK